MAFSTGRSWEDLARRYSEIVDRAIQGADISAFLRSAGGRRPAASQLETIDRLLARMSDEVRYTGMELGEGGLIPRTPAETLKRRFGDCKDKAVLLTALLRASDIPAYVALLNAGEDEARTSRSRSPASACSTTPSWWCPARRRSGSIPPTPTRGPASCRSPTRGGWR